MNRHDIDIEGLPEGWAPVAFRIAKYAEHYFEPVFNRVECAGFGDMDDPKIIVEKIQPRRIVLEETEDKHLGCQTLYINDTEFMIMTDKVWREVKETTDDKLSLSVDECRNVRSLIKDFENLGWFVNPARSLLLQKITEFIKDK